MSDQPRITAAMMFVVATAGDGHHSILVRGRDELRAAVCACLWMGQIDDAPEDVAQTLADLDNPDDWSGPSTFWSWGRSYEDGSIGVQRVVSAPHHDRRVTELLDANTREVERRREAEADIDGMLVCVVRYCIGRMSYIVGTCDGWLRKRWPSLSAGTRDVIRKDIHAALEQERLGRRNLGMQIDIDTWAALYRDMSPGGALAAVVPVDRQGGSPDAS